MAGFILIVIAALFFPGIILRTKSIASGRKGPGIFQPLKDLAVLLRKDSVFSTSTGLIFRIAPSVALVSVTGAMLLLPFWEWASRRWNKRLAYSAGFMLVVLLIGMLIFNRVEKTFIDTV